MEDVASGWGVGLVYLLDAYVDGVQCRFTFFSGWVV